MADNMNTPVDPVRVINKLKTRLVEEISKTALLEALLEESQMREQALIEMVTEMQTANQDDAPKETES